METAAERLHHSASRQERRPLLHIQMQMHDGSPRIHMGPSEERRLIAELPQPRDPPPPAKKIAPVGLVASLIISKALKAAFTTFAQHRTVCKHTRGPTWRAQ